MDTYHISKTCKECGNEYKIGLTKHEAAFSPLANPKLKKMKCPQCGSTEYRVASCPFIEIDEDLLIKWANDNNLHFSEQDEDIILGYRENISLIGEFINRNDILDSKRNILVCALCVVVYDKDDNIAYQQAMKILQANKTLLNNARSDISKYIGKKVFPQLGLKW